MKQVFAYIKHLLYAKSKRGFGIHSPFLFKLVSQVINNSTKFDCFADIESERKKLLKNKNFITVNDLGSGSKKLKGLERRVTQIAKTSVKPPKQAQLLFRLVKYFDAKNILELGSSLGITTSYLAKASSKSRVIGIEGCPNIANIARQTSKNLEIKNTEFIIGDFNSNLSKVLEELKTVDFVFFDGNHTKKDTLNYFYTCLAFKNNDSVFVFDDINISVDMQEAWFEIKKHSEVAASLDLFYLGIVFFREGMSKEHLKIGRCPR